MIGRRAVVGLSLLSALLFCALAAQSASAALTTSKNTTAFTCVKDGKGDFTDAHCDNTGTIGSSEYKHELIKVGETTAVDATNEKVTPKVEIVEGKEKITPTGEKENALLKGEVVGGGKVELECTTVKNNTAKSWIRNAQPNLGEHTLEGFIETEFSNCTVKLLTNCTTPNTVISEAKVHGVEGLEGPKGEKNAMGVEFIGAGEKEIFTTLIFQGEKCGVKGTKFTVKGKVIATNGPTTESAQENKETGATLVFTPKFSMQELKLSEKPSEFSTITTVKMSRTKEEEEKKEDKTNPISLTTTT